MTKRLRRALAACAAVTAVAVTVAPMPAVASETVEKAQPEVALTANAATIANARSRAELARASGRETTNLRSLRASLARRAAEHGDTYLSEDLEAFALSDKVSMAVARGTVIKSVDVRSEGHKVVAKVASESGHANTVQPAAQGQGMGWSYKGGNVFVIKIHNVGEMESRFKKSRYEGNDAPDLVSMRRKAMGRAYGTGYVEGLWISSRVKDKWKPNIRWRWNSKPGSDFTGNCNSTNWNLSIKGLGWSFWDCDDYKIKWDSDYPGYYRNYMDQGRWVSEGSREVGWHNVLAVRNGKGLVFSHFQMAEISQWGQDANKCSSWNKDKTCYP